MEDLVITSGDEASRVQNAGRFSNFHPVIDAVRSADVVEHPKL
jgi:hypothetical protein